jgi:hypothetical protein
VRRIFWVGIVALGNQALGNDGRKTLKAAELFVDKKMLWGGMFLDTGKDCGTRLECNVQYGDPR